MAAWTAARMAFCWVVVRVGKKVGSWAEMMGVQTVAWLVATSVAC